MIYDGLDLDVYCGEVLGIVGGLGIGKFVLMWVILGFISLNKGCILVFGEDVCFLF